MTEPSNSQGETLVPIADCIDRAVIAMWPRRAHQELLFDLGERKGWDESDRRTAVQRATAWLVRELELPESVRVTNNTPQAGEADDYVQGLARRLGTMVGTSEPSIGVATWVCGIAPALGSSAKTLANSLSGPIRADRGDHRWLRAIARAERGGGQPDAWCFHRRSPASMVDALGALAVTDCFDAGDALLVLSLLALWQRRRSTESTRANRGRSASRRATPKPVAGLIGALTQPAQAVALVNLAHHLGADAGRAVSELAIECALTEAHLAPHPSRVSWQRSEPPSAGESWLKAAGLALSQAGELIAADDRAVFSFRIERQRAWREARPQADVGEHLRCHPYVAACLALEQTFIHPDGDRTALDASAPGLLMLLPALRSRGILETP
jgi:hypothetical protein